MTGERADSRCYFCNGRLESKLTTIPFVIHDSVIVVKQVPAEVCTQCGEAIMSSSVAQRVDSLLKEFYRLNSEVSVITYSEHILQPAKIRSTHLFPSSKRHGWRKT